MSRMNPLRQGFVFAGCFMGAGYVSGQELWQYFGGLGAFGFPGLFLTLLMIFLVGCLCMMLARRQDTEEPDQVMVPFRAPLLHNFAFLSVGLMFFAVMTIMTAGIGALLHMMLGIPHIIGCAVFSVIVMITALAGMNGLVAAFSAIVPPLVVFTLLFGVLSIHKWGYVPLSAVETQNRLHMAGGFVGSAFNYMCYNILSAVGIFCPLAYDMPRGKARDRKLIVGNAVGTFGLAIVAVSVLVSIAACRGADEAELPMVYVASGLAPWAGYIYAFLLGGAMFGTSLSCVVGLVHYFSAKSALIRTHERASIALICFASFCAGLFGFGDLIGVVYPMFGYASAVFVIMMLISFVKPDIVKNRLGGET